MRRLCPLQEPAGGQDHRRLLLERREFFKIAERGDAPIATEAVARIAQIYAIEKDLRDASADARRAARPPLIDALKSFFEQQLARLSGGSGTAKSIRYVLRHWDGLTRFLDDGRIELDTNIIERSNRGCSQPPTKALHAAHLTVAGGFTKAIENDRYRLIGM